MNLDQWASLDGAWQNGNLNGNNSRYPEGGVVPFRLALEGLTPGSHSIHLNYDFTANGHKAYDYLATWNATNASGAICQPSGGAISSMCPSLPTPQSAGFPGDLYVSDGLYVLGAQVYAGIPRRLTIWGGTITWIGPPVHSGSASGNSSVDVEVRFTASASAVLLAWGGHLAQSSYWNAVGGGAADGASMVSGAPWHMRTMGLDGTGNKNQDRSIQPSAIVGALPPGGAATPPPGAPQAAPTPPDTATLGPPVRPSRPETPGSPAFPFLLAVAAGLVLLGARLAALRRGAGGEPNARGS